MNEDEAKSESVKPGLVGVEPSLINLFKDGQRTLFAAGRSPAEIKKTYISVTNNKTFPSYNLHWKHTGDTSSLSHTLDIYSETKYECLDVHCYKMFPLKKMIGDNWICLHPRCQTIINPHIPGWCWLRMFDTHAQNIGTFPKLSNVAKNEPILDKEIKYIKSSGVIHISNRSGSAATVAEILKAYSLYRVGGCSDNMANNALDPDPFHIRSKYSS